MTTNIADQTVESAPTIANDAGSPPATPADAKPADSSPAPQPETVAPAQEGVVKDDKIAKTPVDVVRDVLSVDKPKEPAPAKAEEKPAEPVADPLKTEEPSDEDDKALPFNNHPRFRKALKRAAEAEALIKTYEPQAQQFQKIETFLKTAGLSPEEAATGYEVMALMKNAPRDAIPIMESFLAQLRKVTGEELPKDLAEQVETGAMSESAALEVSRARFDKAQAERDAATQRERATSVVSEVTQTRIRDAVLGEAEKFRAADPNWSAKEQLIADRSRFLLTQRQATSPEIAVEIFKEATAYVNETLAKLAPQPKPIVVVPPRVAAQPAAVPVAQPTRVAKTPLDVVMGVLQR